MPVDVIFPSGITNGTPVSSDRVLFSATADSEATKDCALSELPISTATQTVLDNKVDKVTGKGLSTEDYSTAEKSKLAGIATGANVGVVPNTAITGATKTKITYDSKGLVTSGTDIGISDITISTNKLLGRNTAGSGAIEEITLGTGLSFSGTTLNSSGSGDVVGPASAVNSNFASFDLTTGKLIKDSGSKASDFATALGVDDNYVTDAEKVVIGNTSNTNSGDNATNSQYSGLATSKQDTLVSGTNLKTINSNSLLGSGDLSVATVIGYTPENQANKENTTLDISTTKYPTNRLVKEYADSLVVGLLDYRGAYDASVNTFPASGGSGTAGAILKGDMWIISIAGTLGSVAIQIGDSIIANVDTPGQTAGNWDKLNANISYVPEDQANKVTSISGASTDVQYGSAKLLYDQLGLKANLISPSFTTPSLGVATATSINGATITSGTLNGSVSGSNTGDQTITLTGDVTGGGTGTFATTLANSGAGAGTYTNANVTVDAKGRVTTITSGSSGSGGTVSVTNEVPTGLINGSNTVYTLTNSATNNEIVVTLNGLKQIETTDYSLSGTTLTFVVAPFTGAILEVFYVNSTSSAGYQTNTKSTNYTLVNTDYVILADTTSGNITLTLPTAVGQSGRSFVLKKVSLNNTLTIATTSSQTIDGSLTEQISSGSKGAITVHSDGNNWHII